MNSPALCRTSSVREVATSCQNLNFNTPTSEMLACSTRKVRTLLYGLEALTLARTTLFDTHTLERQLSPSLAIVTPFQSLDVYFRQAQLAMSDNYNMAVSDDVRDVDGKNPSRDKQSGARCHAPQTVRWSMEYQRWNSGTGSRRHTNDRYAIEYTLLGRMRNPERS